MMEASPGCGDRTLEATEKRMIEVQQWDGTEESQARIVEWAAGRAGGMFGEVQSGGPGVYFIEFRNPDGKVRAVEGDVIVRDEHARFHVRPPGDLLPQDGSSADRPLKVRITRDQPDSIGGWAAGSIVGVDGWHGCFPILPVGPLWPKRTGTFTASSGGWVSAD